jgi:Ca2+/Na+ antiporter
VFLIAAGVLGIVILGRFLGAVAERVVVLAGVPEWAVGWILGFITSLPEMTAFFAVFASAHELGRPDDDTDCQENLDSLAASNMSNLGLIYPIGVAVFLLLAH